MSHQDTIRQALGLTNRELRRAIRRPDARIVPDLAIRSLLDRTRANPARSARTILRAETTADQKIAAIHALARVRDAEAEALLIEQLTSQDPHVMRATLWALARTGDAAALERMAQVPDKTESLAPTLRAARRLLAFRLGVEGFGFRDDELPKPEDPPREKVREMEIAPVDDARLAPFAARIRSEAPGLDLSIGAGTQITCLGKPLWILPSALLVEDPGHLAQRPAVPMGIFSYDGCLETPYLKGYVLSEPGREGVTLTVTRLRGQVTHRGTARLDRRGLSFSLHALRTRFDPAAVIEGALGKAGRLDIERALVSEDLARQMDLRARPREIAPDASGTGDRR